MARAAVRIVLILLLVNSAPAQSVKHVAKWSKTKIEDKLHDQVKEVFMLKGIYLTKPSHPDSAAPPELVIRCVDGDLIDSYFDFNTILNDVHNGSTIETRMDGRGGFIVADGTSSDLHGVFFSFGLARVLKAKTVIIGPHEYLASQIVAQFEIPDPAGIYEACNGIK